MTTEIRYEAFHRSGALEAIAKVETAQVVAELSFSFGRILAPLAHFDQQ